MDITGLRTRRLVVPVLALVATLGLVGCSGDSSGDNPAFDRLAAGQRVYDQTGTSLDPAQSDELQQRLDRLKAETGADVIVYVRDLDADSDATLEQVEDLQQQWVTATRIDQDTAGAILINREPGDDDEARAGIFVGSTYDDGNVPPDEQEAIVEDALIPPLRDGDVAGSLDAGIERLSSSIRNGPPVTALDRLADGPGSTWMPWTGLVISLFGLAGCAALYRRRATPTVAKQSPTTVRPDHTTEPAIATALVHGGAQASGVPATVLALAADDALSFEQEEKAGKFGSASVRIRLLDEAKVRGDLQQSVWGMLVDGAEDGVVDGKSLAKVARGPGATKDLVEEHLRARGWLADGTGRIRAWLGVLAALGLLLTIVGIALATNGALPMLLTAVPAAAVFLWGLVGAIAFSRFSVAGRDAARPWEAYRDGLKQAGKNGHEGLDLDAALPDIVALGLASTFDKQLKAATGSDSEVTLRAFTSPAGATYASGSSPAVVPWVAFSGVFVSSGGAGSVTSAGGAGGGGGAAGST